MDEQARKSPQFNGNTSRRVEVLEAGLQSVRSRLDGLERSNRAIESDVRSMKDQINSMQSSIQEMLMIFRNLSEKMRQQAARDASHFSAGNVTSQGGRAPPFTAGVSDGGRKKDSEGDELVRDPRHLREDEDEGA
jgi:TolA-binding protein